MFGKLVFTKTQGLEQLRPLTRAGIAHFVGEPVIVLDPFTFLPVAEAKATFVSSLADAVFDNGADRPVPGHFPRLRSAS